MNEAPQATEQPDAAQQMEATRLEFEQEFADASTRDVYEGSDAAMDKIDDIAMEAMKNPYREGSEEHNEKLAELTRQVKADIELARDSYVMTNYDSLSDLLGDVVQGFENKEMQQYSATALLDAAETLRDKILPELEGMSPADDFLRGVQQDLQTQMSTYTGEIMYEVTQRLGADTFPARPERKPLQISPSMAKRSMVSAMNQLDTTAVHQPQTEVQMDGMSVLVRKLSHREGFQIVEVEDAQGNTYRPPAELPPSHNPEEVTDTAIKVATDGRFALAEQDFDRQMVALRRKAADYDKENPIATA